MQKNLILAAMAVTIAGSAFAQTTSPSTKPTIDQIQVNQAQRIQQGVQSGRLTEAEAARLQKGETRIDAAQARASADGTISTQEKKHLAKMAQHENKAIHKQKHDRQNDRDHNGQRDSRQHGAQKP